MKKNLKKLNKMKEYKLGMLVKRYINKKIYNEKKVSIVDYYNYPQIIYDDNNIIFEYNYFLTR